MKTWILAAAVVAASGTMGSAASLTIERFSGDDVFTARCNQGTSDTDCEYAVAEGRAGNNAFNGDFEFALGVPNTLTTASINAGGGSAQYDWAQTVAFSLAYDAAAQTLTFGIPGAAPDSLVASTLDLGSATSIFVRARGRDEAQTAALTGLMFNGTDLGDLTSDGSAEYLAFKGFSTTADWLLEGTAELIGGRGSAPSFQVKMTDATVVPLPAAAWLLLAGLGGLGLVARRQPVAA